jgi:hypothetical protein
VRILVDEFNAVDSVRAARRTADFVHQFEQHPGIQLGSQAQMWLEPQVQEWIVGSRVARDAGSR